MLEIYSIVTLKCREMVTSTGWKGNCPESLFLRDQYLIFLVTLKCREMVTSTGWKGNCPESLFLRDQYLIF